MQEQGERGRLMLQAQDQSAEVRGVSLGHCGARTPGQGHTRRR
jgi:hypothetical protein